MRTFRRLYLYAVAFVSLEVVTWSVVSLLRSLFNSGGVGGAVNQLAIGLAFILVGLPVFALHWILAQRESVSDEDARWSLLRGIFLYAVLLATLIPVSMNVLAFLSRNLQHLFKLSLSHNLGDTQTWSDNLTAIVINSFWAAYFSRILREVWQKAPASSHFGLLRRIYRYIWVIFGLSQLLVGSAMLIGFLLSGLIAHGVEAQLAYGLALALVGGTEWAISWRVVQQSLAQIEERQSALRQVLMMVFSLLGLVFGLIAAGNFLYVVLMWAFGKSYTWVTFADAVSTPTGFGIPLLTLWAYHSRLMLSEAKKLSLDTIRPEIERLYHYILAGLGLIGGLGGVFVLLTLLINLLFGKGLAGSAAQKEQLASGLTVLLIAVPLWMLSWRNLSREVQVEGEASQTARLSRSRKGYLYLALFVGTIGLMFSAGALVYHVLQLLLGGMAAGGVTFAQDIKTLLIFGGLLAAHARILRADNLKLNAVLADAHAAFPVLILDYEDGQFTDVVMPAVQQRLPNLPVAVHFVERGAPDESLSAAKAVILPAGLAVDLPEAVRLWLAGMDAERLVAPLFSAPWHWLGAASPNLDRIAADIAQTVQQMAEEGFRPVRRLSPWVTVGVVLAILFVLPTVIALIGSLIGY